MFGIFTNWRKPKRTTPCNVLRRRRNKSRCRNITTGSIYGSRKGSIYERLRQTLIVNNVTLYCSNSAFDNFLNGVALNGRTDIFIDQMLKYMSEHPAEVYIVCKNGEQISMAKMQKSEKESS